MGAPRLPRGVALAACLLLCCCCSLPLLARAEALQQQQQPAAAAADASAEDAAASAAAAAATAGSKHNEAERAASLQRLFQAIDLDADGQLKRAELERYAAASLDMQQEGWAARDAVHASQEALDGPDAGASVSAAELAAHLRALMQVLWGDCSLLLQPQVLYSICRHRGQTPTPSPAPTLLLLLLLPGCASNLLDLNHLLCPHPNPCRRTTGLWSG